MMSTNQPVAEIAPDKIGSSIVRPSIPSETKIRKSNKIDHIFPDPTQKMARHEKNGIKKLYLN